MLLREEAKTGDTIVIDAHDGKIEASVRKARAPRTKTDTDTTE